MTHFDASRTRGRDPSQIHPVARFPEDWDALLRPLGHPAFRPRQLFRWIHQRGQFDPQAMSDLNQALRQQLQQMGLRAPLTVEQVQRSSDGTRKLLLRLEDGNPVECVLIPMTDQELAEERREEGGAAGRGAGEEASQRVTLCVSTQVGCAMGCVFCASGKAGLKRGLGAAEIVAQVLLARGYLEESERLRNLVFMGMGEPLHHYEETARAVRLLTHPDGVGMSPRKITISTVGLVPGIRRLGEDFDGKVGLAISLHAPDDPTRDQLLPINARYDVGTLIAALRAYPLPKRRRITIEYTLIDGKNDSVEHAKRLARLLVGLRCKVNLIPMNPIAGSPLRSSPPHAVEAFRQVLATRRVSCSVRKRRGDEVDAACGQLAFKQELVELRVAARV